MRELDKLQTSMSTNNSALAIEEFTNKCHVILEGNHSNILNAVLTVAAIALVAVLCGIIGFAIGFAAGAWTGPGAFITGLMAGSAAAVAVVATSGSLGLAAGGLTAFGLFSDSKEMTAVNTFAKNADKLNEVKQLFSN